MELLSQYIERHLGDEALRPIWQRHRQRTRTAEPGAAERQRKGKR